MKRYIAVALGMAVLLTGCAAAKGIAVNGGTAVKLTAAEAATGRKLAVSLEGAALVPGQRAIASAVGAGTALLPAFTLHQHYLVLQIACTGAGTLEVTTVDAPKAAFPPPPSEKLVCSNSVTVIQTTGSGNASTAIAQTGPGISGSVWQAVDGGTYRLEIKASKRTVWAISIAASDVSH
jgi:hypothetical protein